MKLIATGLAASFLFVACNRGQASADAGAVDAGATPTAALSAGPAAEPAVSADPRTRPTGTRATPRDGGAAAADAGAKPKTDGGAAAASGKAPGMIGGPCADGWRCNGAGTCKDALCMCEDATNPKIRRCGDLCSPVFDVENCGKCGNKCKESEECAPGPGGAVACVSCTSFGPTYKNCHAYACNDLKKDLQNCGACGTRCAAGQMCADGTCKKL